jgi:MFS family permease
MGLSPEAELTPERRDEGLRRMVRESGYANAAGAVTTGVILTAFALHLGAPNSVIGLLAALPFLGQLLQAPAILLVEKLRTRKRIAVWASVLGRSLLVGMGLLAFARGAWPLTALLVLQAAYCALGAVGSCAWNAWVRDLAPEERLGKVFGRRTLYATGANLIFGVAAALALDFAPEGTAARQWGFAGLYVFGAAAGLISCWIVAGMPEPTMPRLTAPVRLLPLLEAPLRDKNFRRLIAFLASWQFAVNLATPFFTVFMVKQLGYPMTFVMIVSVASQVTNALSLLAWSPLSDRFANKSVLAVAAPLYIVCIAGMVGASQFHDKTAGGVYLFVLHVVMGGAVAGVTLASTNIALKLSPKGESTGYLAANAMGSSLSAGLAPILGGLCADFFGARRLELLFRWTHPGESELWSPLTVSAWDFYFLIASVLGLYALHRLSMIKEVGEIRRREMVEQLMLETGRVVQNLSSVAGLRTITAVPVTLAREARLQARLARARLSAQR